jgi:hypothetical protein
VEFIDWQETIMCYCSADSFEPEMLKARLRSDPDWNEEFRHAFEAVLATGDLNATDWTRNVNFHFKSEHEVANWLRVIFSFLYLSGSAPNSPTQ